MFSCSKDNILHRTLALSSALHAFRGLFREHVEIGPATWKLPAVKSAANRSACHKHAAQGDFNEDHIRIPR